MSLIDRIGKAMPPDTVAVRMAHDTKRWLMHERDSMRLMSFGKPIGTDMPTCNGRPIEIDPMPAQVVVFVTSDNEYTFAWKNNP